MTRYLIYCVTIHIVLRRKIIFLVSKYKVTLPGLEEINYMSQSVENLLERWVVEIRRGVIQLLVCAVLLENDLHGKEICDRIFYHTNQTINVPLGTVYPLLRRFVTNGIIETYKLDGEGDQRKTIYKLNSRGTQYYVGMREEWLRYSVAVQNAI